MLIELHMIQNFAPSNLNRDDTNSPKDCKFGDTRRARISSQSLKRAIRTRLREGGLLTPEDLGHRTKRAFSEVTQRLVARGHDDASAQTAASLALAAAIEKAPDKEGLTQYLIFVGDRELTRLADICEANMAALVSATPAGGADGAALPKTLREQFSSALDGGKAVDVALFGRMIADAAGKNVDGSTQVAHALSTHQVEVEFDYFSAVDDLQPGDVSGAGMIGTGEFNSACFYRYLNLDVDQLVANLKGDRELARRGTQAFLDAAIKAVPSGKQNSMSAQNPPSLVLSVVREDGHWPWSLANAFVTPISRFGPHDLVDQSVTSLFDYWERMKATYGPIATLSERYIILSSDPRLKTGGTTQKEGSAAQLVAATVEAAFGEGVR